MNDSHTQEHVPTEIKLNREEKVLYVSFGDGQSFALPAELLRVESPSADVQGHAAHQKKLIHGRRHVGIMAVEAVGNYAVRLKFDDMHDTGLYSWNTLYNFGINKDTLWQDYLDALSEKGLSRDP